MPEDRELQGANENMRLAESAKSALRFEEAIEFYERGIGLASSNVMKARCAWEIGSLLLGVKNQSREAAARAEQALLFLGEDAYSYDVTLLRGLSCALLWGAVQSWDPARAARAAKDGIRWLESALCDQEVSQSSAVAYLELARLLTAQGNTDEAIRRLREYLRRDLGHRERALSLAALADALRNAGRLDEAEARMTTALDFLREDLRLDRPAFFVTLAVIQRARGRTLEALESLRHAWVAAEECPYRNPEILTDILWHRADLHVERGEIEASTTALLQLIEQFPGAANHDRALLWLADCEAALGNRRQARLYYERLLTHEGASAEARIDAQSGLAALLRPNDP
jgi:tetratricopeptide (TPR) repeat protein